MSDPTPIELLKRDHRKVEKLFSDFSATGNMQEKKAIAERTCLNLKVHARLEEELFYPEVSKTSSEGKSMIERSLQEHQEVKDLVAELEKMDPEDAGYEEKFNRLKEKTLHHVQEEESQVFPFANANIPDELGAGMSAKMMAYKGKNLAEEGLKGL